MNKTVKNVIMYTSLIIFFILMVALITLLCNTFMTINFWQVLLVGMIWQTTWQVSEALIDRILKKIY